MRCKHSSLRGGAPIGKVGTRLQCLMCGEYVSLGPSSDEGEAVRIEMRLALLLCDLNRLWEPGKTRDAHEDYVIDICSLSDPATTAGKYLGFIP